MPTAPANDTKQPLSEDFRAGPRIISRSDHQVSRKNIDKEALKVLYRLRDAGYTAYLVGGGVRDLYLGKIPKDFDISTDARPGQVRKLFKNSRLIGRRFRLVQVFYRGGKIIEVSTFRRRSEFDINGGENADQLTVLPANNTYGTPEDDAFRRDLTINALFYEIEKFSIIDYTGGVEDLDRGIIRIIGDPDRRITRDPVRMMRVVRHAARNNFSIERATWQAINTHRDELNLCPVSRVRDEVMKDLRGGSCHAWADLAIESGLFEVIFPFYEPVLSTRPKAINFREMLTNILEIIDQVQKEKQNGDIPEHLLFTLLLLPWAIAEQDIMALSLKGAEAYRFARKIRARLDEILVHLNVKRSVKEAVATILANLHHFQKHDKRWPKWLKRKSYYQDCKRLYRVYCRAHAGEEVDSSTLNSLTFSSNDFNKPRRKKTSRRRGRPAFSKKSRDGVFGLQEKGDRRK